MFTSKELKMERKEFRLFEETKDTITIQVVSVDIGDDFGSLPYVKWDGSWLETYPGKTYLTIPKSKKDDFITKMKNFGYQYIKDCDESKKMASTQETIHAEIQKMLADTSPIIEMDTSVSAKQFNPLTSTDFSD